MTQEKRNARAIWGLHHCISLHIPVGCTRRRPDVLRCRWSRTSNIGIRLAIFLGPKNALDLYVIYSTVPMSLSSQKYPVTMSTAVERRYTAEVLLIKVYWFS